MANWTKQDNTKIGGNCARNLGKHMPGMKATVARFEMHQRYMKENHIRLVPKIKNPTSGGFGITKTNKRK
jgi:hypothetical protein